MSQRFDLQERLIIVPARISGPAGDTIVRLALDTGASSTLGVHSLHVTPESVPLQAASSQ